MNGKSRLSISAVMLLAVAVGPPALATVSIQAESKAVASTAGASATFVDVYFVTSGVNPELAGFQLQVDLAGGTGATFGTPVNSGSTAPARPPVFATNPTVLAAQPTLVRVTDYLALGTKPIVSQEGLVRIPVQLAAYAGGAFDVVVHPTQTGLSDGLGEPIPFGIVGGRLTVTPPPSIWNVDAGGLWSAAANWLGPPPDGVLREARFDGAIAAPRTVTLDGARTVGKLHFENSHSYTLAGPGPLVLDNLGAATIDVAAGTHEIAAPLTVAAGNTLTKLGPGTLVVSGPQSHAAGATIAVAAGTLRLASDAGAATHLASGATLELAATQHAASLAVQPGCVAAILPGGQRAIVTPALSIATGGAVDLGDGGLILPATAATRAAVLAQAEGWAASGAANLAWTGPGLRSSVAAADPNLLTAVGVMPNDNGLGGAYHPGFFAQAAGQDDVLARFTYYGDADLSGTVDGTDYALIDNGFNAVLTGWFNGDFDYSGIIDGTDFALIDNAFNAAGPPLGGLAAVPEPGGACLAALAAAAMLVARSRRRSAASRW